MDETKRADVDLLRAMIEASGLDAKPAMARISGALLGGDCNMGCSGGCQSSCSPSCSTCSGGCSNGPKSNVGGERVYPAEAVEQLITALRAFSQS